MKIKNFEPKFDEWLSAIIGHQVWKLNYRKSKSFFFKPKNSKKILIYSKIPTNDHKLFSLLLGKGFELVDTLVNLTVQHNKIGSLKTNNDIRLARPDDKDQVYQLAYDSFKFSRFHNDPKISDKISNKIKGCWASNFFEGNRGDEMIIAENRNNIVGFLLLIYKKDTIIIDLIAVSNRFSREGIAQNMISFLLNNKKKSILHEFQIKVGTQLTNIPSLNFYEKLGFKIHSSNYVLHNHSVVEEFKF